MRLLSSTEPRPIDLNNRVLQGLLSLSAFLVDQTSRFAKSPSVSAERRRLAKESVPSEFVKDPTSLAMDLRKLVLGLLAQPLDELCFPPAPSVMIKPQVAASPAPRTTPAKRKLESVTPSITPIVKPKIRHLATTPKAAKVLVKRDDGEIISRKNIPVSIITRKDVLVDPSAEGLGARPCEVRTTTSELEVTRMLKEGNGERMMEIRRVSTTIERVRWVAEPLVAESTPEVKEEMDVDLPIAFTSITSAPIPSTSVTSTPIPFTSIPSTLIPSTVYSHSPLPLVESVSANTLIQSELQATSPPQASSETNPFAGFEQLMPSTSESSPIYPSSLGRLGQDDTPRQLTV